MGSLDLDLLLHQPSVWQLLAFLSIFVMMTVLSKRYVAPLIKALKPRRQTRTNSRALSVSSEKRGKEVPSEADVVVIGVLAWSGRYPEEWGICWTPSPWRPRPLS